ncbi:MAG: UDP-2,3-diacylglucosamine diphosphatase [Woeseiaceae bacterium]
MNNYSHDKKYKFRSIWISDTHLGTKHCHAESLIKFLLSTESEYLYLVGDIIDLWAMKKSKYWPDTHTEILQIIKNKSENGTKVIYTPGNHDRAFRRFCGTRIANIQVEKQVIHTRHNGEKLLVLHGDQVDPLMQARCRYWMSYLGDIGYDFLLFINHHLRSIQKLFGYKYWSLARFIKNNLKNAMEHVNTYESLLTGIAEEHNVDGIVCGHIHYPKTDNINGVDYFNTGDWVEHCTALSETESGEIKLIHWSEMLEIINQDELSNRIELVKEPKAA